MRLIQVVPRLGPWDGIGDYATRLAARLSERHGVESALVEGGGANGRAALAAALAGADGRTGLLLHYVGYGYAKRGAPLWLARDIASAGARLSGRLGVVFHELYAMGWPWQSSFWLSGLQRHVARRIARDCRFALVTREASHRWLEGTRALDGKPVTVLPISSGVGEPADLPPWRARPPTLVIWGSASARSALYGERWAQVAIACQKLGVAAITDIGPPAPAPSGATVAIIARGRLPAEQVSQALLNARYGLLAYPAQFLGKSSIFAAYAAHGLAPLVIDDAGTTAMDGLVAGRHFLRLRQDAGDVVDAARLEEVAAAARAWYQSHSTAAHADATWRMLEETRP